MYSEITDFEEKKAKLGQIMSALEGIGDFRSISDFNLALEVGGSGGLLAGLVCNAGVKVICTDIVDVQVKYNGEFPRLLKEKFNRNGLSIDLGKIEFHTVDAQELIYANDKFDFVFSLNALEHIPNPLRAVEEVWRVLKPGGAFYASFDPVWTADSGSHFFHYTKEPWLHLLVEDDEYCSRMKAMGATDSDLCDYRFAMNRHSSLFYLTEMHRLLNKLFSKAQLDHWSGCVSKDYYSHPNLFKACERTGLSLDQLLIRGFSIVAIK